MSKKGKGSNKPVSVDRVPREVIREAVFMTQFREDMRYWAANDSKRAVRAWDIVEDVMKNPFQGIGKPEPLKYGESNLWSRRLNQEDRILYRVSESKIEFLQARYHYDD